MRAIAELEAARWEEGYASGSVYNGDPEHIDFLNEVYALNSQANPLHTDLWPSGTKYESEIVAMTATMLGGGDIGDGPGSDTGVCGTVSSGGSESIQLAMKTYRDHALATRGITEPEMIVPDQRPRRLRQGRASTSASRSSTSPSAPTGGPTWPPPRPPSPTTRWSSSARRRRSRTGSIDPIEELSELARARGIGFHTDACLGGFVLPWAEKLG